MNIVELLRRHADSIVVKGHAYSMRRGHTTRGGGGRPGKQANHSAAREDDDSHLAKPRMTSSEVG
jgi:hypothetical protein